MQEENVYQEFVKKHEGNLIFQKGVRLYLEGAVGESENLLLPNWIGFWVVDGKFKNFVKIPLVHILLKNLEITKQKEVLQEFARCDCEMFEMSGWCRHLVASCYKTSHIFKPKKTDYNLLQTNLNQTLDNIFSVENAKNEQKWLQDWQDFLSFEESEMDGLILRKMENSSLQAFKNGENILEKMKNEILESLKTWHGNKRSFKLFAFEKFWLIGAENWWRFWQSILKQFEPSFFPKIIAFLFYFKQNYPDFFHNLNINLSDLHKNLQADPQIILQTFKENYSEEEIYLLAIELEFTEFLQENIEFYSPDQLLLILQKMPDLEEIVQMNLLKQLKIWVDFLKVGDYKDLIKTIKNWRKLVGESYFLDQILAYIFQNHATKRSLIKALK